MDFPVETTFRSNDDMGVIRLKVAAICICLDMQIDSGVYFEEEVNPFIQPIEKLSGPRKRNDEAIDPHAFVYLEPTGNLAIEVDDVLNALKVSIEKIN